MKTSISKGLGIAVAAAVIGSVALIPTPAQASVSGERNTAIALGLGTIYALSQHNSGAAALLGIGTAVAAGKYENDRHKESERNSRWWYRDGRRDRNYRYQDNNNGYGYGSYGNDNGGYQYDNSRYNGGYAYGGDRRDGRDRSYDNHRGNDGWSRDRDGSCDR